MQIVIDIPKDLYEGIERRDGALETEYVCDELMKAVDNGTPLDKIRAEIAEYKDDKVIHTERNEMIDIVLEIIDKYKAESEDKV